MFRLTAPSFRRSHHQLVLYGAWLALVVLLLTSLNSSAQAPAPPAGGLPTAGQLQRAHDLGRSLATDHFEEEVFPHGGPPPKDLLRPKFDEYLKGPGSRLSDTEREVLTEAYWSKYEQKSDSFQSGMTQVNPPDLFMPETPTTTKVSGKTSTPGPGTLQLTDEYGNSYFVDVDANGSYSGTVPEGNFQPVKMTFRASSLKAAWQLKDGKWTQIASAKVTLPGAMSPGGTTITGTAAYALAAECKKHINFVASAPTGLPGYAAAVQRNPLLRLVQAKGPGASPPTGATGQTGVSPKAATNEEIATRIADQIKGELRQELASELQEYQTLTKIPREQRTSAQDTRIDQIKQKVSNAVTKAEDQFLKSAEAFGGGRDEKEILGRIHAKLHHFDDEVFEKGGMTEIDPPSYKIQGGAPVPGSSQGTSTRIKWKLPVEGPGSLELRDANGKIHDVHVDKDGVIDAEVSTPNFKPVKATFEGADRHKATWELHKGTWTQTAGMIGSSQIGQTQSGGTSQGQVAVRPGVQIDGFRIPAPGSLPPQQVFDLGQYLAEVDFLLEYGDDVVFDEEYDPYGPASYSELEHEYDRVLASYDKMSKADQSLFQEAYYRRYGSLESGDGPYSFTVVDDPLKSYRQVSARYVPYRAATFVLETNLADLTTSSSGNAVKVAVTEEYRRWLTPLSLSLGRQQLAWGPLDECGTAVAKPASTGMNQITGTLSYPRDIAAGHRLSARLSYQAGEDYASINLGGKRGENTRWGLQGQLDYRFALREQREFTAKITIKPTMTIASDWYLDKWKPGFNDRAAKEAAGPSAQGFGWHYHGQAGLENIGFSLWKTDAFTHTRFVHDSAYAKDWHCGEADAGWDIAPVSSLDPAHWPRTDSWALPHTTIVLVSQ